MERITEEFIHKARVALESPAIFSQLEEFHLPPQIIQKRTEKTIRSSVAKDIKVVISGETENLSVYLITGDSVLAYTPFSNIKRNVFVGMYKEECEYFDENTAVLPINSNTRPVIDRLQMPKVILINPYVQENYPLPRLSLNISILAAYLRKHQKAEVSLLDTQLGLTLEDIVRTVTEVNPDIVGISIPHAQTTLAMEIADSLYDKLSKGLIGSKMVLGNFIAASLPELFLRKYPKAFVCMGEGEKSLLDMCDYVKGRKPIDEVSGIAFMKDGLIKANPKSYIGMDDLPAPAMDTIEEIKKYKGALTHEWSRGCFWKCSFCPREHKPNRWKGMSPEVVRSQWEYFSRIIEKFGLQKRVYVADEETIGGSEDFQTERMKAIARELIKSNLNLEFDSYCRVDQVYQAQKPESWHSRRMGMWKELQKAGLSRVFVGVESGSDTQLQRYGKGIRKRDSLMAIRILSALGVNFRFGFITFDPLMTVEEIIENINFLERRDAFLRPLGGDIDYGRHFSNLENERFIYENSLNIPIYAKVSYMLASLETLVNSSYVNLLKAHEKLTGKKLIFTDTVDINIGRYKVAYLDETIGEMSRYSQLWIDRNFSLMYTVKSLYKIAEGVEREFLMGYMMKHRELSHFLLKAMVYSIYGSQRAGFGAVECLHIRDEERIGEVKALSKETMGVPEKLGRCLAIFEGFMGSLVADMKAQVSSGVIKDTEDGRFRTSIKRWEENKNTWTLLNPL